MEFSVLGPLEAARDGRSVDLGGARQRALLTILLLQRGTVVAADQLIDQLWGEHPPATAAKTVQVYVSRLRKLLGEGVLITQGQGYLIDRRSADLDVDVFEALLAEGRDALGGGDAETATGKLREALAVWRGPALADFAYESFAQAEIARLEEERRSAIEDRIEADLQLGRHRALVAELESLVAANPNRERLLSQLMLALYGSGRQVDALDAYRRGRQVLSDELGLDPGPELRALEQRIIAHDPTLDPPGPISAARRRVVARPRLVGAGGVLLLVAAIAAAAVKLSGGGGGPAVRVAPNSVAAIDVRTDRVVGVVPVGNRPGPIAVGFGSLWVGNLGDQTVSRVDPATLQTLRTISAAGPPTSIASGGGGVWVAESANSDAATGSALVGQLNPEFNKFAGSIRIGNVVPAGPTTLAATGNSVWVAPPDGLLTRVDSTTAQVLQRVDPNASPGGVAVGEGAVWLTDNGADNVVRVDPSGLETTIPVGNGPTSITTGAGAVWVVDSLDDDVVRINPSTGSATGTIRVGSKPAGIVFGAGSIWVANSGDGTVTRIDPATGHRATIAIGGSPQSVVIANGRAWVTDDAPAISPGQPGSDGGTLRVLSTYDVDYMDPALAYAALSEQLVYATCDGLEGYPDSAGAAGSQLVPEVAQSRPTVSADGLTYTFTIRPGYRFSPPSDQPVTAQAFKYTIERTLRPALHSPLAQYLSGIVGARAYMAGDAKHISGVVASGNSLAIHLLTPVPDLPSRLALTAFCPVPIGTPADPTGIPAVPSDGPYYVTSYAPGQGVVLRRNPNYHGFRPHHFARIELAVGIPPAGSVGEIESGAADYTSFTTAAPASSATALLASRLAGRYGPESAAAKRGEQQYFVTPTDQLDYYYLNTHRSLFSDVRVRQAVNEAIDRRALAALGSPFAPLPEPPADHYLAPGMPGYRPVQIYPVTPDVAAARRLIRLAHAAGRTAVLYTCNALPCPEQAQILKSDLAAIGLRVIVDEMPFGTLFARETTPGSPYDLGYQGWIPDYPDPSDMLNQLLDNPTIGPTLQDPHYQRLLAAAARLSGPERYLTYGALDLDLARNAAPLLAFGNISSADFFSARIGCETYNPVFGMDLAALCLRR